MWFLPKSREITAGKTGPTAGEKQAPSLPVHRGDVVKRHTGVLLR
jgi:hypothetical protein